MCIRDSPQVIWDTPRTHKGWKHMNGHYHRSSKGGGEWEFFDLPQQWTIGYKGLTFNPVSYTHLDVYKRQLTFTTTMRMVVGVHNGTAYGGTEAHVTLSARFTNVDQGAVSYTHLDVYKRQILF